MSLKLESVPVPAFLQEQHDQRGGAELELYSVARPNGFLHLMVAEELAAGGGGRVTHIAVSFSGSKDPESAPTRRPNDKELREIRAHFAFIGTFDEDNSACDAGGLVRHLWKEED